MKTLHEFVVGETSGYTFNSEAQYLGRNTNENEKRERDREKINQ